MNINDINDNKAITEGVRLAFVEALGKGLEDRYTNNSRTYIEKAVREGARLAMTDFLAINKHAIIDAIAENQK